MALKNGTKASSTSGARALKGNEYRLYVSAGEAIMENELVDNLKDGQLKTAYMNMRLAGDSPDSNLETT